MMRSALICCFAVLYAGCNQATTAVKGKKLPPDSPIIIGDGSPETHVRHEGAKDDIVVGDSGGAFTLTVADPGYMVTTGECWKGIMNCPMDFQKQLNPNWSLKLFATSDTTVMPYLTLMSADNATITATFMNGLTIGADKDRSGETNGGDIAQRTYQFQYAVFTNGGGGTAEPITCTGTPCRIRIHYHN